MKPNTTQKTVNKIAHVLPELGIPRRSVGILALLLCGCSNITMPTEGENASASTAYMAPGTANAEPNCETQSIKRLSLHGGLCIGVGCGESEYRLSASLDTPTGVYTERFKSSLSVVGTTLWNRNLKASANSYQTGFRSENFYRSDLAIHEPVNGPVDGHYSVTFWLRDERKDLNYVCILHREKTFSGSFNNTETFPSPEK